MKKVHIFLVFFIAAVFLSAPLAEAKKIEEHIYIVPAGNIDMKIVDIVYRQMADYIPASVNVEVMHPEDIPDSLRDDAKGGYDAQVLLKKIGSKITIIPVTERVLIMIDVDLFGIDGKPVIGLADDKKGFSVMSVTRLRNEFYGMPPSGELFRERVLKTAVSEFCQSRGLKPCSDQKCVLSPASTITDMDKRRKVLCHDCKKRLRHVYEKPLYSGTLL